MSRDLEVARAEIKALLELNRKIQLKNQTETKKLADKVNSLQKQLDESARAAADTTHKTSWTVDDGLFTAPKNFAEIRARRATTTADEEIFEGCYPTTECFPTFEAEPPSFDGCLPAFFHFTIPGMQGSLFSNSASVVTTNGTAGDDCSKSNYKDGEANKDNNNDSKANKDTTDSKDNQVSPAQATDDDATYVLVNYWSGWERLLLVAQTPSDDQSSGTSLAGAHRTPLPSPSSTREWVGVLFRAIA
jgi:hypothetical protein